MDEKDFKIIESQEELDKIISERLKREREKLQVQIKTLEGENAEIKSNLEKAKEKDIEIEKLQGRIKGYEKADMKRKIALENNIPYKLAERIKGETEDEMISDAKELSNYFLKKSITPPLKNPEIKGEKSNGYKELLKNLNLKGE